MNEPPRTGDSASVGFIFNLLGRTVTVVSGGLASIALARSFSAEIFGQWAVATVYATLVGTFVDGGLGRLLIRDIARDPKAAGSTLGRVLKGRGVLAALITPIALVIGAAQTQAIEPWSLILMLVVARLLVDVSGTFGSALFAFDRFRVVNLVETARRSATLLVTLGLLWVGLGTQWVALATLLLSLVGLPRILKECQELFRIDFSEPAGKGWRDAVWFWVSGMFFWINGEIDQLMLSQLAGNRMTGIYAAAVRLVMLFYIIPRAVNDTVVRRLFRSAQDGRGLNRQLNTTVLLLSGAGAILAVVVFGYGTEIIGVVYGDGYAESGPVFATYGAFLGLFFLRAAPSWFLSSADRVPLVTGYLALACALNVGLNLWLIPSLGALGAAYSTVASELLLTVLCVGTAVAACGYRLVVAMLIGFLPGLACLLVHLALPASLPWIPHGLLTGGVGASVLAGLILSLKRGWRPLGIMDDQPQ